MLKSIFLRKRKNFVSDARSWLMWIICLNWESNNNLPFPNSVAYKVCILRYVICIMYQVLIFVLLDLPGLLFFSTYTLLVLFWAEIYHQASAYFQFFACLEFGFFNCKSLTLTAIGKSVLSLTLLSRQEVCQQISSGFFIFRLMVPCTLYRCA